MQNRPVANVAKSGDHYSFIEGMRGFAAFYVVLQHFCSMVDPYHKLPRGSHWLGTVTAPFWFGHLAVSAFIVISGFCLQLSLFKHDPKGALHVGRVVSFLKRRCRRILPPYYACLALSVAVCYFVTQYQKGMPWSQYVPVTRENLLAHVLMVHNFDAAWMYKINGVLWSIAIEFQLYFLFPIFVWMVAKRLPWVGFVAGIGVFYAVLILCPDSVKLYPWYGSLFILGIGAARLVFWDGLGKVASMLTLLSASCMGLAVFSLNTTKEIVYADSFLGVGVALLLALGCAGRVKGWKWLFSRKALVGLGAFSYSLYLVHHPVLQVLYVNRPKWAASQLGQFSYLVAIALPVILLTSYGFYRIFEKPFISAQKASR